MFMTAKQITRSHQPLSGDRQFQWFQRPDSRRPHFNGMARDETDREVWDRKYEEALDDSWRGLQDLPHTGQVTSPVTLQSVPPSLTKRDQKPEVLGGHHRIAVMRQAHPDKLMPVLWDHDIMTARNVSNRYYKYT